MTQFSLNRMPWELSLNRWLRIPLGVMFLVCLGAIYSWSIFRIPLEGELHLSAVQSALPFTFIILVNSAIVPLAGMYIDRFGSRTIAAMGGFLVGLGYILAGLSHNFILLLLAYGVLAAIGLGMSYNAPMAAIARWFPDRRGIAIGLTVMGFGLSPLITAPIARSLIDRFDASHALVYLGLGFMCITVPLAFAFNSPPSCPLPRSKQKGDDSSSSRENLAPWRSSRFYGLWICVAIGAGSGLLAISISAPIAGELIHLDSKAAAFCLSLFAIFNGGCRPLFGWLTEYLKPRKTACLSFGLIFFASGLMLFAGDGNFLVYLIAFSLLWMSLGSWVAITAISMLIWFDPQQYARNFGILLLGYSFGGFVIPLFAGIIRDRFGSYYYSFLLTAILAIIGFAIALLTLQSSPTGNKSDLIR